MNKKKEELLNLEKADFKHILDTHQLRVYLKNKSRRKNITPALEFLSASTRAERTRNTNPALPCAAIIRT
jgi:hypothetical protein